MGTHFVKMDNSKSNLSTTEKKKNQSSTVTLRTTLLKKMATAVGIKKGSPSQILQAFLDHSLTL
jgi:hypothetical protein